MVKLDPSRIGVVPNTAETAGGNSALTGSVRIDGGTMCSSIDEGAYTVVRDRTARVC